MRVRLEYGLEHLDVELRDGSLIETDRQTATPSLLDPAGAVRAALETPLGFPPLRRALTPDDRVTIVVDEVLPRLVELLVPLLDHIGQAGVQPSAITLLHTPSASPQRWLEDLPEKYRDVCRRVHTPGEREQMSYLATMKNGCRLYLHRSVVDADQVIVLSGRGYDPLLGYSGAEGSLFPALSDEETIRQMRDRLSMAAPGATPWPARQAAIEAAWLLGAPFFVQIIPGKGDEVLHVLGGLADTSIEGQRLLDARWRVTTAALADTVVASVSGDPARQGFADLAAAAASASRVVQPDGRIILLSSIAPALDSAVHLLRQVDDPDAALALLHQQKPNAMAAAAFQWANAARRARIYLLSELPAETTEELFAIPLENGGEVERMLRAEGTYMVLDDAHQTMAVPPRR